jgi:hypothetical protein
MRSARMGWVLGLRMGLILLACLAYFSSTDPTQDRRSPASGAWTDVRLAWKKVNITYFSSCTLCAAVYLIAVR